MAVIGDYVSLNVLEGKIDLTKKHGGHWMSKVKGVIICLSFPVILGLIHVLIWVNLSIYASEISPAVLSLCRTVFICTVHRDCSQQYFPSAFCAVCFMLRASDAH